MYYQCYTSKSPHDFTPVEEQNLQHLWREGFQHTAHHWMDFSGFQYIFYLTLPESSSPCQPVAMAAVARGEVFPDQPPEYVLFNVTTLPEFQCQGHMKHLLTHVQTTLHTDDVRVLYLTCDLKHVEFYTRVMNAKQYIPSTANELNLLSLDLGDDGVILWINVGSV